MPKTYTFLYLIGLLASSDDCFAQGEPFSKRTIISGLNSPWEITYGPNDSLWVTENVSYLVKRINITNGASTTLLNLSALKNFTANDGGRWPQGGLMGMAIHPDLFSSNPAVRSAKPWVYLAYVYNRTTGQNCSVNANASDACYFKSRIVRYDYNGNNLSNPTLILDNIPGSNDHNSGRLIIGPDLKLYYTIGDMGAGQFNNSSRTNYALAVDVLEGKVIRLNTESDGDASADAWVPDDNPFYNSAAITPQDYVYTLGHRNAQGIVWANVSGSNVLYSSEHGDKSDDEVNRLVAGKNYGWNQVSGYCDGNYNGMTLGGYSPVNENNFCSTTPAYENPVTTFFTVNNAILAGLSSSYLSWPTVAPSSIDFYWQNKIPGWQGSLLIPCLKAGKVYRIQLNASGTSLIPFIDGTDTTSYFRGEGRYRDIAVSTDGLKIFLACDASGQTSGPTGSFNGGGTPPPNAGSILEYSYNGIILPITNILPEHPAPIEKTIKIFPNPAHNTVVVSIKKNFQKPYFIQVYNSAGINIAKIKTTKTETTLSISDFRPGIYFVEIRNAFDQILKIEKITKL